MRTKAQLRIRSILLSIVGSVMLASCTGESVPGHAEREADPLYLGDAIPWRQTPSVEESRAIIPEAVLKGRVLASVTMRCRMTREGGLSACIVDDQSRLEGGLADAAIRAAELTRIEPHLRNGRSVEGLYAQVDMTFDVGGPADRRDIRIWPSISGSRLSETLPAAARYAR